MTYPVRSHRRETVVTTNCEKSAEVIVPQKKAGRTEQFKTSIEMYVPEPSLTRE